MTRTGRPRWRAAIGALACASALALGGCGDNESDGVQPGTDGSDKIGDAGLAPDEQSKGAGGERGTGGSAE